MSGCFFPFVSSWIFYISDQELKNKRKDISFTLSPQNDWIGFFLTEVCGVEPVVCEYGTSLSHPLPFSKQTAKVPCDAPPAQQGALLSPLVGELGMRVS